MTNKNTFRALFRRKAELEAGNPVTIGNNIYWLEWKHGKNIMVKSRNANLPDVDSTPEYIECLYSELERMAK